MNKLNKDFLHFLSNDFSKVERIQGGAGKNLARNEEKAVFYLLSIHFSDGSGYPKFGFRMVPGTQNSDFGYVSVLPLLGSSGGGGKNA